MELVVSAIVALLVVGFIGYPLLREQVGIDESETALSEEAEELYRRKESTYSALKELEFDYKTGKLSEADYRELEGRYRAEAIEVLEAIDVFEKEGSTRGTKAAARAAAAGAVSMVLPDDDLDEAEPVASIPPRSRKRSGKGTKGGAPSGVCPECGSTRIPDGALFCGACGASLAATADDGASNGDGAGLDEPLDLPVCDDCGADLETGHRFCGACGGEVRS